MDIYDKKILIGILTIIIIILGAWFGLHKPDTYIEIADRVIDRINAPTEMNLHVVSIEYKKHEWWLFGEIYGGYTVKAKIINNGAPGHAIIRCKAYTNDANIIKYKEKTPYFKRNDDIELKFEFEPTELSQNLEYKFNITVVEEIVES